MVEDRAWSEVPVKLLASATPWRTFRWFKGQKHYSGICWSAMTNDHVINESRLELARLLFADFDPSVRHIVAQQFLLKATLEGKVRKHILDYLLITGQGQRTGWPTARTSRTRPPHETHATRQAGRQGRNGLAIRTVTLMGLGMQGRLGLHRDHDEGCPPQEEPLKLL